MTPSTPAQNLFSFHRGIAGFLRRFRDLRPRLIARLSSVHGSKALAIIVWETPSQVEHCLFAACQSGFANFLILNCPAHRTSCGLGILARLEESEHFRVVSIPDLKGIGQQCRDDTDWKTMEPNGADSVGKPYATVELSCDESPVSADDPQVGNIRVNFERIILGADTSALEEMSRRIQEVLQRSPNANFRVEIGQTGGLNPINGKDSLPGMLMLAFPEIHWELHPKPQAWDPQMPPAFYFHRAASTPSFGTNLFDGTGLREYIRSLARGRPGESKPAAPYLPSRKQYACTLDDEEGYAYFNAYCAYRNGFRSFCFTRFENAKSVLAPSESDAGILIGAPDLTFEDVCLNFPDNPERMNLSDLGGGRRKNLPRLGEVVHRCFVTSSQTTTNQPDARRRNREFVRSIQAAEISKPLSGMFDLWKKARLERRLRWTHPETGRTYYGVGEGFLWPPPEALLDQDQDTGHGSPGRLLQVAELMIRRAQRMLQDRITTVREAVTGAVLATDAIELLGSRTPTTSLEALSLKHQFETLAECQFSGTEYHILLAPRLAEIRRECRDLSRWFNPQNAKSSAWNSEMHILNQLVRIFREYGQFEEEQACMNRVRHLQHCLWMRSRKWGFLFWPVLRYAEFLLASFPRFCLALLVWLFLLSLAFAGAQHVIQDFHEHSTDHLSTHPFWTAVIYFLGTEELTHGHWLWIFLSSLAAVAGLAHLGVFISHLYTIVARK